MKKNSFKILLFHGVIKKNKFKIRNYNSKHILETKFFKILKALKKKHFFLSMEEICYSLQNKQKLPKNSLCVTFDDGFENNFSVAAPILDNLKIPTTFYFSTDFIEKNSISWIDKLEYCLENKIQGEIILPWQKKKVIFNNRKTKINLLKNIRRNIKNNLKFDINSFVKSFFFQLNEKEPTSLDSHIDKKINWTQVKKLNNNELFTIGGHSHNHVSLGSLSDKNVNYELEKSFSLFKDRINLKLRHYSYPEGRKIDFNYKIIKKLKDRGILACPTAIDGINNLNTNLFELKRKIVT